MFSGGVFHNPPQPPRLRASPEHLPGMKSDGWVPWAGKGGILGAERADEFSGFPFAVGQNGFDFAHGFLNV
jgi:hypothetical protein